jgi:hypothetical protein
VGSVGDYPEASGPRHDGASAALAFFVEHGEARVNPGDRSRRWLSEGACQEQQGHYR